MEGFFNPYRLGGGANMIQRKQNVKRISNIGAKENAESLKRSKTLFGKKISKQTSPLERMILSRSNINSTQSNSK